MAVSSRADLALEPYAPSAREPWSRARVHHLHWRAGFGATWEELQLGLERGPDAVLESLFAGTRVVGVPESAATLGPRLEQAALASNEIERLEAVWFWRMLFSADPLGERLTLLWHDHFATSFEKVQDAQAMGRQNAVLREHARAPFGELLSACVKNPALLIWLDAQSNYREHPNENLGRELMELFTLGEGNYGERDVREVARALTGWRVSRHGRFLVFDEHHDSGEKHILGRKGQFDGDDLLAILLEEPATARRLAWRLSRSFLGEELVTEDLLDELARGLSASGLDVRRCVERILRSRLFFSDGNLRVLPTTPAVHVVALTRALECFAPPARTQALAEWSAPVGQRLYHPPSVFGWPHGKDWITTGTLLARARFARALVGGELSIDDDEGPVARLVARHSVSEDPEERVSFIGRLLLGQEPEGLLRSNLVTTAGAPRARACEEMVVQLCTAPACQLS